MALRSSAEIRLHSQVRSTYRARNPFSASSLDMPRRAADAGWEAPA